MKIKPPHKKASVEDLIQWMKNRQWTTTLRSEEKNIILKELADEMFLEHPFTGKRLRFILMNQRKDLWEKDTLKSPLVFAKSYQEEWSFDRISKTLLRAYIRHAFYFDKEKPKGKEYQTFRYYVAVAQRFNLLFLLHFLIFYVRKVRIVNDKTKINFGKCA